MPKSLKAVKNIYRYNKPETIKFWFIGILICIVPILLLPWTQNIRADGKVTTLFQNQRPQSVDVIIGGRILKWWIKEGDYVKKGDTLIQIAEIKDEYFDPNLIEQTQKQINAKNNKANSYNQKAATYVSSLPVLLQQRNNKINMLAVKQQQIKMKISADSADYAAAIVEYKISKDQLSKAQKMYDDGIISKVEFEKRTSTYQKSNAVKTEKENKLSIARNELLSNEIESYNANQDYSEKILKAQAEQSGSEAEAANTNSEVEKLKNQISNYKIRRDNYFVIAPQDGQIIKVQKFGINEIVKEGEMLLEIVPTVKDFAVELFINPMDQVLIDTGQEVRLIFDGYPSIVFSGWPNQSFGTFVGIIKTVETNTQQNGKFRILVVPKPTERAWPSGLKIGVAAKGIALLKNVTVGYELWRNINGFPPSYYKKNTDAKTKYK